MNNRKLANKLLVEKCARLERELQEMTDEHDLKRAALSSASKENAKLANETQKTKAHLSACQCALISLREWLLQFDIPIGFGDKIAQIDNALRGEHEIA